MTPTSQDPQSEALRLAAWLNEGAWHEMRLGDVEAAGRELRRLHKLTTLQQARLSALQSASALKDARIAELEAQLAAVGAGGVSGERLIGVSA